MAFEDRNLWVLFFWENVGYDCHRTVLITFFIFMNFGFCFDGAMAIAPYAIILKQKITVDTLEKIEKNQIYLLL